jgi:hypothetical protein
MIFFMISCVLGLYIKIKVYLRKRQQVRAIEMIRNEVARDVIFLETERPMVQNNETGNASINPVARRGASLTPAELNCVLR